MAWALTLQSSANPVSSSIAVTVVVLWVAWAPDGIPPSVKGVACPGLDQLPQRGPADPHARGVACREDSIEGEGVEVHVAHGGG